MKAQDLAKRVLGSRLLRWGVVAAAVGVGAYEISSEWREVHHALDQIGVLASFEALLALLVMQFATLRVWRVLLAGLGSPLRSAVAGRILFIGQLGKYIPGSVWPVLAQMELGARAKVPRPRSASASILTMLLSLLTGLLVAAVTLPFAQRDEQYLWVFLAVPVVAVCLHPKVLNPLLNKLFKVIKRPPLDRPLTGRVLAHALAWSFTSWIFNGLQIWILAEKFGAPAGKTILLALGGYAFAWCAGFLFVIAPAGAGIREALLITFLTPVIGSGPAWAVTLCSRAVNTVSDLLVAGIAAASRRRLPGAAAGPAEGKDPAKVPAEATTPVSSASDNGAHG
ncbi:MAG TPA: lysylphosphatidylglycerol synthase domain-containing protein [Trebonia sp.]